MLEKSHDAAQHPLGTVVQGFTALGHAAKYRYVKFLDAVAYLAGHAVNIGAGKTAFEVTNDISGAMAGQVPVGMVFQTTVPTQNQYGWVQSAGIATYLAGSAALIAGDFLQNDGTTDGALDEATMGGATPLFGQSLATVADAATGLMMLNIGGV
jgi:hypothetical protein